MASRSLQVAGATTRSGCADNYVGTGGIPFRTLVPAREHRFYIIDLDRDLRDKILAVARKLGARVSSQAGNAHLFGDDMRPQAKVVFEEEIKNYETKNPNLPPTCDVKKKRGKDNKMKSINPCFSSTVAEALERLPGPEGQRFATIFEHGSLLVEIYAPRGVDPQKPHTRDEIYFVVTGTGEYVCEDTRQTFGPSDILFAAAGSVHRFENFSGDLTCGSCSMDQREEKMATSLGRSVFSGRRHQRAIRWYEEQLGFIGDPFPSAEPYVFAILRRDDVEIMLQRIEGYQKPDLYSLRGGGVWDAYIHVEGIKTFTSQCAKKRRS